MLGKWDVWYKNATEQMPYGDRITYFMAEDWLSGLDVEDWGCGYGWFRTIHFGGYTGIDGSDSNWCDTVVDLTEYTSSTPGLLLRHVLEHNHDWKKILDNALASFTKKICVVLFTPLVETTHVLVDDAGIGVPDIAFNLNDILTRFDCRRTVETIPSHISQYGVETVIKAYR